MPTTQHSSAITSGADQSTLNFLPEWAPQTAVLLTWPHKHSDWLSSLNNIEPVYTDMAKQISLRQSVIILAYDDAHRKHISGLLDKAGVDENKTVFYGIPTNDTWIRDYGPLTVDDNGKLRLLDFRFNGYGEKYPCELDDAVCAELERQAAFELIKNNFILEGGSIDTDGQGTLLTTTKCLLSSTRNTGLSKQDIETLLKKSLGAKRILWIEHADLLGDDTDGHIDMLARFTDSHTICYQACDDVQDEHYEPLRAMKKELSTLLDNDGKPYTLIPLPFPEAQHNSAGERLPASYANFLIINEAVLVPIYGVPQDSVALKQIQKAFPERDIVPIQANALIEQSGSLHCATMQLLHKI